MKKIIYLLVFLISIVSVFALTGGNKELVETFEDCSNLTVFVQGELEIDEGEYSLNCEKEPESMTKWYCECDGNFSLYLITKVNTLNTYNIIVMNKDILIDNKNIIINNMSYENGIFEIILTSEGNQTFTIDLSTIGVNFNQYRVNDGEWISIVGTNGIYNLNLEFSTNTVQFRLYTPTTTTNNGGGSSTPTRRRNTGVLITPPTPEDSEVIPEVEGALGTPEGETAPTGFGAITGAVVGVLGVGGSIIVLILAIGGLGFGSYSFVKRKGKGKKGKGKKIAF